MTPPNFARTADCARRLPGPGLGPAVCIFAGITLTALHPRQRHAALPPCRLRAPHDRPHDPRAGRRDRPRRPDRLLLLGLRRPARPRRLRRQRLLRRRPFDTRLELQLFAWRPPGAATGDADSAWCPGSVLSVRPRVPLRPGLPHRVRMQPSAVGWAGEQLDVTTPGWVQDEAGPAFLVEFTVDPTSSATPTPTDTDTGGDTDTDGDTASPRDRRSATCSPRARCSPRQPRLQLSPRGRRCAGAGAPRPLGPGRRLR
jgi:hypothetical protein